MPWSPTAAEGSHLSRAWGHPLFNLSGANLQFYSCCKIYRVKIKCKLRIINKDYTSFIVTLKHN